jgi:hypothetical protein
MTDIHSEKNVSAMKFMSICIHRNQGINKDEVEIAPIIL